MEERIINLGSNHKQLYKLKYLEHVADPLVLSQQLKVPLSKLMLLSEELDAYLVSKLGRITPERLQFLCPNCFKARLITDMERGETVCTECVKPDTIIPGDYVPISELKAEHNAVVGTSKCQTVQETMGRPYSGEMIKIKACGLLPLEVTPEHPLLVRHSIIDKHCNQIVGFSERAWIPASQVTPKKGKYCGRVYLIIPRVGGHFRDIAIDLASLTNAWGFNVTVCKGYPTSYPLTIDSAWLMGLYIAEGSVSTSALDFSLGHHETILQEKTKRIIQQLGYAPQTRKTRTATIISVPSRLLTRLFPAVCGKGAAAKRIPEIILFHTNAALLESLLEGYMAGDGCETDTFIKASTVSKVLSMQLQLAYARLGKFAGIRIVKGGKIEKIENRTFVSKDKYIITHYKRPNPKIHARPLSDCILTPIQSVSIYKYSGAVHNIRTPDHTYLVSNALVHNCGSVLPADFDDPDSSLPFDVTFQPTSALSIQHSLGSPLTFRDQLKMQKENGDNHQTLKTFLETHSPDLVGKLKDGELVYDEKYAYLLDEETGTKVYMANLKDVATFVLNKNLLNSQDRSKLFHMNDMPLRVRRIRLITSAEHPELDKLLKEAYELSKFYNLDGNYTFNNNLGANIRRAFWLVHELKIKVPKLNLAETVFYATLNQGDKNHLAGQTVIAALKAQNNFDRTGFLYNLLVKFNAFLDETKKVSAIDEQNDENATELFELLAK